MAEVVSLSAVFDVVLFLFGIVIAAEWRENGCETRVRMCCVGARGGHKKILEDVELPAKLLD